MEHNSIAIVGGGFSGGVLLIQLIRQAANPVSVTLVNAGYPLIKGIAYSTNDDDHLLNVRAGRMSAFPEDPLHFVKWINAQNGEDFKIWQTDTLHERFVPRRMYGAYLDSILSAALNALPEHIQVRLIEDEVTDLIPKSDHYEVVLKNTEAFTAKKIAITTGHAAAHRLPGIAQTETSDRIVLNPWSNTVVDDIPSNEDVFIIGAGLTMADTVLSLLKRNHQGAIYALSRHGVLPLFHPAERAAHNHENAITPDADLQVLYRQVKEHIRAAYSDDVWHEPVLEDIRPHTQKIWQAFSLEQKQQFIRHLSSKWQRLRHRLPLEIADKLTNSISIGQLKLIAGTVNKVEANESHVMIHFLERPSGNKQEVKVARLINCTGPETNLDRNGTPFVKNMLNRGLIRPCALKLGYDATPDGKIIGLTGSITENIFTMGPALRGILWESVAVPELKVQARDLAAQLLG